MSSDLPDTHDASAEGVPLLNDKIVIANRYPSWLNWWTAITAAVCIGVVGLIGIGLGDIGASLSFVGEACSLAVLWCSPGDGVTRCDDSPGVY